jgi:hypothetical protein
MQAFLARGPQIHPVPRLPCALELNAVEDVRGLAIGYDLVRLAMVRAAQAAGRPPIRLSDRHALLVLPCDDRSAATPERSRSR